MAGGIFGVEESDEDSVATDYTVESDAQDTYEVERILCQERDVDDGVMKWLVKWVGYPLAQATWEPLENLDGEESSVLAEWQATKDRIEKGEEEKFNLYDWERSVEQHQLEKDDRHRRRRIKRQKKGLPLLSSTEPSVEPSLSGDNNVGSDTDAPSKSSKVRGASSAQQSVIPKKGFARKVTKKRPAAQTVDSLGEESGLFTSSDSSRKKVQLPARKKIRRQAPASSGDESGDVSSSTKSSSGDSMLEEIASKTREAQPVTENSRLAQPLNHQRKTERVSRKGASSKQQHAARSTPMRSSSSKEPTAPSTNRATFSGAITSTASLAGSRKKQPTAKNSPSGSTAGNSAPIAKRTKTTPNVMGNWAAPKTGGRKLPNFTNQAKDNQRPAFAFNSRTERPPDPSALNILDPKTGKQVAREAISATSESRRLSETSRHESRRISSSDLGADSRKPLDQDAASSLSVQHSNSVSSLASGKIHSAYGRRSPSASKATRDDIVAEQRASPPAEHASGDPSNVDSRRTSAPVERAPLRSSPARPSPSVSESTEIGKTRSSIASQKPAGTWQSETCEYWLRGTCKYTKESCRFAHWHLPKDPRSDIPKEHQMCYFWFTRGRCVKEHVDCDFAHHYLETGRVAKPPTGSTLPDFKDLKSMPSSLLPREMQTCYFWYHNGHCGAVRCGYPHQRLPSGIVAALPSIDNETKSRVAPMEVDRRQLPQDKQTCYFWYTRKSCQRMDSCKYAHHDTGIVARAPPGYPEAEPRDQPAHEHQEVESQPRAVAQPRSPAKWPSMLTCWWWHTYGSCKNAASSCKFAHYDTGQVAAAPGTFRQDSRNNAPTVTSNAGSAATSLQQTTNFGDTAHVAQGLQQPIPFVLRDGLHPSRLSMMQPSEYSSTSPLHITASSLNDLAASPHSFNEHKPKGWARDATIEYPQQGSSEPLRIEVKFEDNDMTGDATGRLKITIEHSVLASDIEKLIWMVNSNINTAVGFIRRAHPSDQHLGSLIELCELQTCGFIATAGMAKSKVVIYPSNSPDWRFIDRKMAEAVTDRSSELQYAIIGDLLPKSSTTATIKATASPDMRSATLATAEEVAKLDVDTLFFFKPDAVFLMIPPAHATELEVYARIASEKINADDGNDDGDKDAGDKRTKVYHAGTKGAWSYFRQKYMYRTCVIVLHPTVSLLQIPGWHEFVMNASTQTQIYSMGSGRSWYPYGAVVLITDDVFRYHPEKATKVIQHYLDATSSKPEGMEFNRIAARPGLKQWLFETFVERGRAESQWLDLYGAVCDLVPLESEDYEDPNPLPGASMVGPSTDEVTRFSDVNDSNQGAAQEALVSWFAAWAAVVETKFRRVIVCHEPGRGQAQDESAREAETSDPRGWAKRFQNVGVFNVEEVTSKELKILAPRLANKGTRNWLNGGRINV